MDRDYNFFNYVHPLKTKDGKDNGVVALSHITFGVDGIPETRMATGLNAGAPVGTPFTGDEPATMPTAPIYQEEMFTFSVISMIPKRTLWFLRKEIIRQTLWRNKR